MHCRRPEHDKRRVLIRLGGPLDERIWVSDGTPSVPKTQYRLGPAINVGFAYGRSLRIRGVASVTARCLQTDRRHCLRDAGPSCTMTLATETVPQNSASAASLFSRSKLCPPLALHWARSLHNGDRLRLAPLTEYSCRRTPESSVAKIMGDRCSVPPHEAELLLTSSSWSRQ
jgi:hypothetical protein